MMAATCRALQAAIARDGSAPAQTAATAEHLRTCADCGAVDRARARVRDGILAAGDDLDDLTRTRVLARLLEGRRQVVARRGSRAWLPWTLAFSAVMVLGVMGILRSTRARDAAALSPFALEPYAIHGGMTPGAQAPSSGGLDRVELPAHASMRARLGPAADFVLVGPLVLAVRDGNDRHASVELRQGTLVGDFDGTKGRGLRIVTADATVDIVGTRFLVEATAERTRVSVEHGRVRVESHGQARLVGARQEWSTDRPDVEPLAAARALLFERAARGHLEELAPEATIVPAATAVPSAGVPAPAAAVPVTRDAQTVGTKRRRPPPSPAARTVAVRADADRAADGVAGPSFPVAAPPAAETPPPPSSGGRAAAAPSVPSPGVAPLPGASVAAPSVAPAEAAAKAPPPAAPAAARSAAPETRPGETASSLYRRAEAALRQGDRIAGKKLLDQLVRAFPDQPATDSARYELAVMAERDGQSSEALARTREILRPGAQGPFVEPAEFLRCRVHLAQHGDPERRAALACLTGFVRDYPGSPHDEVALRALIELSREQGQCGEARRFAEAYLQRHPGGPFAADAGRVRSQCGR